MPDWATTNASVASVNTESEWTSPSPEVAASEPADQPEQSEQSELDLGVISTGSPEIDQALTPLEELPHRPVAEHPDLFERVLADVSSGMTDEAKGAVQQPGSLGRDTTDGQPSVSDA